MEAKWAPLKGKAKVGDLKRYVRAYLYVEGAYIPLNYDNLVLITDIETDDKGLYVAVHNKTEPLEFIILAIRMTDFPDQEMAVRKWACRAISDLVLPNKLAESFRYFQDKQALLLFVVDEAQVPAPVIIEPFIRAPIQWHMGEMALASFDFSQLNPNNEVPSPCPPEEKPDIFKPYNHLPDTSSLGHSKSKKKSGSSSKRKRSGSSKSSK